MVGRVVVGVALLMACLVGMAWSARAQEPSLARIVFVDAAGESVLVGGGCLEVRYDADPQTPIAICDNDPTDLEDTAGYIVFRFDEYLTITVTKAPDGYELAAGTVNEWHSNLDGSSFTAPFTVRPTGDVGRIADLEARVIALEAIVDQLTTETSSDTAAGAGQPAQIVCTGGTINNVTIYQGENWMGSTQFYQLVWGQAEFLPERLRGNATLDCTLYPNLAAGS
jgi:hypothetical protein